MSLRLLPPFLKAAAAAGGSGVTTYTATVQDNGGVAELPGTTIAGGRLVGWCLNIATAGGAVINVTKVDVAWDATSSIVDSTLDTTSLGYTHASGVLSASSAPLVLGFRRVLHYQIIPPAPAA